MDHTRVGTTALPRFLLLYTALYAAFGVASPLLQALVNARGVPAAQLGLVLSAVVPLGYLPAQGFGPFLVLSLGHAAALAPVTILADALTLGAAAVAARRAPELRQSRTGEAVRAPAGAPRRLLRLPQFRQLVLVAALVLGSHAMHDAFAVIRWCSLVNCRG